MPKTIKIHTENNDFQYVEALRRNRNKRHRNREFFVEGVRPIHQALANDWKINAFVYSREKPLSDWAERILARSTATTHYEMPLRLLAKLSEKESPSELLALVAMAEDDLARIPVHSALRVLVFDRPSSPGNLGTIIRSCDAFAVDGLILTGHGVDLYDPETIRATTGSFFAVPVVRIPGPRDLLPWLEGVKQAIDGIVVVGSSEKATTDVDAHDFTQPTILVIGNETWGMSSPFGEICDVVVRIPIYGSATSLNVASATSVMLYEMDRQRRLARERR